MISIGTDISGLILQNTLEQNTLGLNNSIKCMTTGYKINSAKDDAAGYFVAEKLSTKITSMIKAQQNVDDGIALLKTAEGALDNMLGLLQRLRDLAVQAGNDVYAEDSRRAMQAEADEIIEQIELIRNSTEFNGLNLFYTPTDESGQPIRSKYNSRLSLNNSNVVIRNENDKSTEEEKSKQVDFSSVLETIDTELKSLKQEVSSTSESMATPTILASARAGDIEGAIDVAGNTTTVINIDGINYTVKNRLSHEQTFSYTKNTTTGEVSFYCNSFEIRGQSDVVHNIIVAGSSNYVYGGDLADKIQAISGAINNNIYGNDGDDNIIIASGGGANVYGQGGNDTITNNNGGYTMDGGDGDDIINVNAGGGCTVRGQMGNDTINIKGGSNNIYGNEGDDIFNIISGSNNYVDGGIGNNIITDNGTNTQKVNVPGANLYEITFASKETIIQNINGTDYTITNNNSSSTTLVYKIETDGAINFYRGNNFTIKGDINKAHNVILSSQNITFYGGNLVDKIQLNNYTQTVYAYNGDDNIISKGYSAHYIYGGDGSDNISLTGSRHYVDGGSGNDIINTTASYSYIDGGVGDDNIITNSSARYSTFYDDDGVNTINNSGSVNYIYGFGASDNSQAILVDSGQTKTITINNIDYDIKNNFTETTAVLYSHNPVTNNISFSGYRVSITGDKNKTHNVNIYGAYVNFYAGDLNDNINVYSYNSLVYGYGGDDNINVFSNEASIYGGDGNDNIILNSSSNIYGENGDDIITINASTGSVINGGIGNDTYNINQKVTNLNDAGGNNIYNINTSNSNISGSSGNDTFYINGDNNTIFGQGGDDYYVIDGSNNKTDGGTGDNYFVDNGTGNGYTNVTVDPNSGILRFASQGETKTFTLNGKTYTVTNNFAGTNELRYSLNPNTGVITLDGSNLTTNAESDESAILNIRGDNNTINGSNLIDRITIEQGSNNIVNGNDGNDNITMNSDNNSINGGNGNDTIILNGTTSELISGDDGNDIITINSDNNTQINTGIGDDKVTINGSNNIIDSGEGNNTILANGDSNQITAGNGNNKLTVDGNKNIITAGNGNNTIGIQGAENNISVDNAVGTINVIGNRNNISNIQGENDVVIKGNENIYNSTQGDKDVVITGNGNNITTGDGNDVFDIKGDSNIISTTSGDNEVDIRGNSNNYTGGLGIDDIKIKGDSNRADGGDGNDSFMVSGGRNNYIDGNTGDRNTMINNGINTTYNNVVDITPRPFKLNLQVDTGSGVNDVISLEISFNLFDFSVDFSTSEAARDSIDDIDDLISTIEDQILQIGSTINRLEGVQESQTVKLDNLISSLSTVKDADIAEESANFIRYQILQNATASLITSSRDFRGDMILNIFSSIR